MSKFRILDYDIIYLSYDEPNAEKTMQICVVKFLGLNVYTE